MLDTKKIHMWSSLLMTVLTVFSYTTKLVSSQKPMFRSAHSQKLTLNTLRTFLISDMKEKASKSSSDGNHESYFEREVEVFVEKAKLSESESRRLSTSSPPRFPYIICDFSPAEHGMLSFAAIVEHFAESPIISQQSMSAGIYPYSRALYNADETTCFIIQTTHTLAESAPEHFEILPLLGGMKFSEGFIESVEDGSLDGVDAFRVGLCPGVGSTISERDELASTVLTGETFNDVDIECKTIIEQNLAVATSKHPAYLYFDGTSQMLKSSPSCALQFFEIISENSNICSIEQIVASKTSNFEANWITQSGSCTTQSGKTCSVNPAVATWENYPILGSDVNGTTSFPFHNVGITGRGQVVQVSDTGLDVDNYYYYDSNCAAPRDKTGTVVGCRKVIQYYAYSDNIDDDAGHGTHCAGSIAGRLSTDGINGDTNLLDNTQQAGIAYGSKIAFFDIHSIGDLYLDIPNNLDDVFDPGYNLAGAKIHSASWGANWPVYSSRSVDADEYMHANDDFIILVAAGNSGFKDGINNHPGTVGAPATAKNVLSIGASQSGPMSIFPYRWVWPNKGFDHLASFSSRGPTQDGRTKPDVVAPGQAILSASSIAGQIGGGETSWKQGTSMATPVAAGVAALVRDYFSQGFYPTGKRVSADSLNPSGAMVKAIIMNGAVPILFAQNGDRTVTAIKEYDHNANFGRIQLNNGLPLDGNNDFSLFIEDGHSLAQGESEVFNFTVDTGSCSRSDFSITLVWTDPPALFGCGACVLNDLDLTVERVTLNQGQIIYPNGKTSRDFTNNAERVRLTGLSDGEAIKATVTAFSLSEGKQQKFAFVASGCIRGVSTHAPSATPSSAPSDSSKPSSSPSSLPSKSPSLAPSSVPSLSPSSKPSITPTSTPSESPSLAPSLVPSLSSSSKPSSTPTSTPSVQPSESSSLAPSQSPNAQPTGKPSLSPSALPSLLPSTTPSAAPFISPEPSSTPSLLPSATPSQTTSSLPSLLPSATPTLLLSSTPSFSPTLLPSSSPSAAVAITTTQSPTNQRTIRLSILSFNFIFIVRGVNSAGFDEPQQIAFLRVLLRLLSGRYNMRGVKISNKVRRLGEDVSSKIGARADPPSSFSLTSAPSKIPTVTPHVELTIEAELEIEEVFDDEILQERFSVTKQEIQKISTEGTIANELNEDKDWDPTLVIELLSLDDTFTKTIEIVNIPTNQAEGEDGGGVNDNNGGNDSGNEHILAYGIYAGAVVGGILLISGIVIAISRIRRIQRSRNINNGIDNRWIDHDGQDNENPPPSAPHSHQPSRSNNRRKPDKFSEEVAYVPTYVPTSKNQNNASRLGDIDRVLVSPYKSNTDIEVAKGILTPL